MTLLHIHQCTTDGNMRPASQKIENLKDENVFFELKVKTTIFYFLQIDKLFFVTSQTFLV